MIKIEQPVSVIICAYNEAKNIGRVLGVLSDISWIDEIVVVDDCSTDGTEQESKKYQRVKVIRHDKNHGKGGAIASGVEAANNNLLIFLDADLIGLNEMQLKQMLAPVLFTGEAKMTLGVFGKGEITATNIANRIIPGISGQRVIDKKDLPPVSTFKNKRYGVDILLTRHLPEDEIIVVELAGLSQVTKEDKEKFFDALKDRVKMYKDIYTTLKEEKDKGKDASPR